MFIDPTGEALTMRNIINIIVCLLIPLVSAVQKKIRNIECISILKRYNVLQKRFGTEIYYKYIITSSIYTQHSDGHTYIQMKLVSTSTLGGNLYIESSFAMRTIKDWYAYVEKSLRDFIPLYASFSAWCDDNEEFMYALGECATGNLATVLFVLDFIDVAFSVLEMCNVKTQEQKYVIEELSRVGADANSNDELIILKSAYTYQIKQYPHLPNAIRINEAYFSPF